MFLPYIELFERPIQNWNVNLLAPAMWKCLVQEYNPLANKLVIANTGALSAETSVWTSSLEIISCDSELFPQWHMWNRMFAS